MAKRKQSATVDIKIRMKEPLRADIEKSAAKRGVSMNAEMVNRLERTFMNERSASDAFRIGYGDQVAGLVLLLAQVFNDAGYDAGVHKNIPRENRRRWFEDPHAYNMAVQAVHYVLEAARPPGEIVPPDPASLFGGAAGPDSQIAKWMVEESGRMIARTELLTINDPKKAQSGEWLGEIRTLLGDLVPKMYANQGKADK